MWMKLQLKNRKYYLYVKADWFDGKDRELVLVIYGEYQIQFKEVPKIPALLNNIMIAQA